MKNLAAIPLRLCLILVAAVWTCTGLTTRGFAQPSPVGTWDCIIGGSQKGVAYVTFNSDGTLDGFEVITPRLRSSGDSTRSYGDGGRVDPFGTAVSDGGTNFVGFAYLNGFWSYDTKGRVVGLLTEGNDNVSCSEMEEIVTTYQTNIVDGSTEVSVIMTTNIVSTCVTNALTNGVSFVCKVKPGVRISVKGTSPNGRSNLKGVPAVNLPDFSGNYFAEGKSGGGSFNEFHTFSPDTEPGFINSYFTEGVGPGYDASGYVIFSSRKKAAWVVGQSDPLVPLASVFGSYNAEKGKAKLSGVDTANNKYKYKLQAQPDVD